MEALNGTGVLIIPDSPTGPQSRRHKPKTNPRFLSGPASPTRLRRHRAGNVARTFSSRYRHRRRHQTSSIDAQQHPDTGRYRARDKRPFVLVFWSRGPDYSQHNATDSVWILVPGINGVTQHRAITNADNALGAILDSLKRHGLDKDTDVFVTADHGFATVARIAFPTPRAARRARPCRRAFLAYDIADWLHEKVFDPDQADAELEQDFLKSGAHPTTRDRPRRPKRRRWW